MKILITFLQARSFLINVKLLLHLYKDLAYKKVSKSAKKWYHKDYSLGGLGPFRV
jgi:hypothetical protein